MGGLSRAELASRIRADQDAWEALVADVPRERMDEPGPMGDWSFATSSATWRRGGTGPSPGHVDDVRAWLAR